MTIPNVRNWSRSEIKMHKQREKCGKPLPQPIMTDGGLPVEGSGWTHDRLPNGEGCWFVPCPDCVHKNYFDLDGETSIVAH